MSDFEVQFVPVTVTPATTWLFVSLGDGATRGWGEATLGGSEPAVKACARELPTRLVPGDLGRLRFDTLPWAALSSTLLQAQADSAARKAGLSLARFLGGAARGRIGVYANINRRTRDRSPEGMAASARDALSGGEIGLGLALTTQTIGAMT